MCKERGPVQAAILWFVLIANVDQNLKFTLVWKWTWIVCCGMQTLESLSEHIGEARDDRILSRKWNIPMTEIFYARTELGVFFGTKREEITKWTREKFISKVEAKNVVKK